MTFAPPPPDDLIGKTIGQYTIESELGRGGMATVYRATQTSMNRSVAIKVLPRALLHDPTFYERFRREVDLVARLEHPHILPIYDFGQADGIPYIVMRYLGGGSLQQRIQRATFNPAETEKPLSQIAQALDYAHKEGVIHRDIKPGNVLLDDNGNAYLSDFGIARVYGSNMTGSAIIGTPAYMSPEQANGNPLDARSDIYALGVVLFEMLTGREPYQAETPMALLFKHINEPLPPLDNYRKDVPAGVESVVIIATSKRPDDRYASAGEMAHALNEAIRNPDAPVVKRVNVHQPNNRTIAPAGGVAGAAVKAPHADTEVVDATKTIMGDPAATPKAYPTPPPMRDTTTSEMPTVPTPAPNRVPLIVGAVLGVVALIAAAVFGLPLLNQQTNVVPTPFFRAESIAQADYSISMPEDWIPTQGFVDESTATKLIHLWQDENNTIYVRLTIQPASNAALDAQIEEYEAANSALQSFDFISATDTAPNGTIRRSYRVPNTSERLLGGQVDFFYRVTANKFVVVEMYTADSTANAFVGTLQSVLDSLRIRG
jgi:serine/threonine protein kinase